MLKYGMQDDFFLFLCPEAEIEEMLAWDGMMVCLCCIYWCGYDAICGMVIVQYDL